jgi:hypothetical protein
MFKNEFEFAIESFQRLKIECCEKNKGPIDLDPLIHVKLKDQYVGSPLPLLQIEEDIYSSIISVCNYIVSTFGTPELIIFLTEGYCKTSVSIEDYQRGELEEDYKNNPLSDVSEALLINGIDVYTGIFGSCFINFTYDDYGMPNLSKPMIDYAKNPKIGGNIFDALSYIRNSLVS